MVYGSGKIKRAYRIILLVLIFCILSTSICFGEVQLVQPGGWSLGYDFEIRFGIDNFKAYRYDDVQNLYISNNADTKMDELSFQSNELQYQLYALQFNSISESIALYKQLAEQSRTLAKNYEAEMNSSTGLQKETAKQNMQQNLLSAQSYEAELADAVSQKAEIYVQKENCLFINNNAPTLKKQQKTAQLTQFRNSVYQIKLMDEKYIEQGVFAEYAKLQEEEQSINKVKDRAFQADVDSYNADWCYYVNQQDLLKQQIDNEFEKLLDIAGITTTQGAIMTADVKGIKTPEPLSYGSVEINSILNDTKKKQLEDKLRILDGKIAILKEYYSDGSTQVRLALNEKSLAILELSKWTIQRKNILKNAYTTYKNKYNEIGMQEQKAKALYEKNIILLNKYNYGLTSKMAVKEAELKYIQSSCAVWNTLYEYASALSRIENCMSGRIE